MKLVLLIHTGYGVVVYEAGSDPIAAMKLVYEVEVKVAPAAVSLAILHPRKDVPK